MNLKEYLIKNICEYDTAMGIIKQKLKEQKIDKTKTNQLLQKFDSYKIYRDVYTKILTDYENGIIDKCDLKLLLKDKDKKIYE